MMRRIAADAWSTPKRPDMWILVLEAGVALGLLSFIVWWTRPKPENTGDGERR
jgi:hypothetical protein